MHSKYCDGKGELVDYVQQALDHRMISIGFSSHAPVGFTCAWCMKPERLDDYLIEIDRIKRTVDHVEIYKGLEVDFIPGEIGPKDFRSRLDYTIGSIHFIDSFQDGRHWEIDGLHTTFLEGLEKIFNGSIREVIKRYHQLTRQMVATSCPSVIGHLDKIKIQNIDNKFFRESDTWYRDEMDLTIDAIAESGGIVEVNTRGLYQGKSTTTYPSPWILERIFSRNIPITISSDAHHASDIMNRFAETANLLIDIGFKTISVLYNGKWQPLSFNKHGITR